MKRLLVLTLCATAMGCGGFSEAPRNKALQDAAVAAIARGELVADNFGRVKLPQQFAGASVTGEAYVTVTKSGVTAVLFPSWIGKGRNLHGYLYASAPLGAQDLTKDAYGNDALDVFATGPTGPKGVPLFGRTDVAIKTKLDANWYYVVFDLD